MPCTHAVSQQGSNLLLNTMMQVTAVITKLWLLLKMHQMKLIITRLHTNDNNYSSDINTSKDLISHMYQQYNQKANKKKHSVEKKFQQQWTILTQSDNAISKPLSEWPRQLHQCLRRLRSRSWHVAAWDWCLPTWGVICCLHQKSYSFKHQNFPRSGIRGVLVGFIKQTLNFSVIV